MKILLLVVSTAVFLAACIPTPKSAMGFRLPDGDAEKGLQAYRDLQCHSCHVIEGMDIEFAGTGPANVMLGGEVTRVKTYGELVTAIINPTHKIAPGYAKEDVTSEGVSLMSLAKLNEVITVEQLVDLVAFLQPQYDVRPPTYDPYSHIYP